MSDTKTVSFSVDAAGQLRAADFKPRSLKKVIEGLVGEDWKKSPKKLLKAMTKAPDVYVAVFAARSRMIPQYIAQYEVLHEKVRELSAQGLKAMELTKDGLPSQDDLNAEQSNDIFETYAETRREALRCHRALLLMQKATLSSWVQRMSREEFKVLVSTIKELLERNIEKTDNAYCLLKDSPQGTALAVLMEEAPALVKPVGFEQAVHDGVPCAMVSDAKAFKTWCEEMGYEFKDASVVVKKVQEKTAPSPKAATAIKAEHANAKKKTEAKVTDVKAESKAAVKTTEKATAKAAAKTSAKAQSKAKSSKIAVKVIKTEARLATAKPKTTTVKAAPAAATSEKKPQAAGDTDLASRLVQSLQITPSTVEHRSPGRPRKTAAQTAKTARKAEPVTDVSQPVSNRPASRNKSGGSHKA